MCRGSIALQEVNCTAFVSSYIFPVLDIADIENNTTQFKDSLSFLIVAVMKNTNLQYIV